MALAGVVLVSGGCDKPKTKARDNYIEWTCEADTNATVSCEFENTGDAPGGVCLDMVVVCDGTRRIAHLCSGSLSAQSRTSKGSGFDPPIPPSGDCSKMKTENETLTR